MIFTRDFVTRENYWQIASLVTQKSLCMVNHALFFISFILSAFMLYAGKMRNGWFQLLEQRQMCRNESYSWLLQWCFTKVKWIELTCLNNIHFRNCTTLMLLEWYYILVIIGENISSKFEMYGKRFQLQNYWSLITHDIFHDLNTKHIKIYLKLYVIQYKLSSCAQVWMGGQMCAGLLGDRSPNSI